MKRREFIKSSGFLSAGLGVAFNSPLNLFTRNLMAADAGALADKKMIFIFQRGGNDGLNTVIPRGDSDYSTITRPTLYIPENLALDLGNGFAQLHPRMEPIMEIYNSNGLNGVEGPGNLAVIHRVGYSGQSRSHFSSQQYWENGLPGNEGLEEGMFYRYLVNNYDFSQKENSFIAAGITGGSQLVALKGDQALPNFRRAQDFRFPGSSDASRKLLGAPGVDGNRGTGLLGLYSGAHDLVGKKYRNLVHGTGELLGATMETLQNAVDQGPYTPANGATYMNDSFGNKLEQCAMLLKRTDVKVLGVNIGGWDTHNNQGQINGRHGNLLYDVASGYQALYRDLQDMWDDIIIVSMTEFGRTSKENDSRGTDHAEATTMFIAGGGVKGGVYNCDSSTWTNSPIFQVNNRYLSRRTDFRCVFGDIFTGHFGVDEDDLDQIIPAYSIAKIDDPGEFTSLGFL